MMKGPITAIKVFHWSLAASVVLSWLFAEELTLWHEYAGYVALALIAWRLVWAMVGPKSAGLSRYTRGAKKAVAYSRDIVTGRGPRPVGAFPFASLSVLLLFVTVTATSVSGWLIAEPYRMAMLPDLPSIAAPAYASGYEDDDDDDEGERYGGYGGEAMEEIHEFLANFLLFVIFAHVVLMIYINSRKPNRRPDPPGRQQAGT